MNRYCTLFNSNYFIRGLQMIRSLQSMQRDAFVYVLALDDECEKLLQHLKLVNVKIIGLREIETPILLQKKSERTVTEYCWTLTPIFLRYIMQAFAVDAITYVDADLMFYSDPSKILQNMGEDLILLTPHRFTPEFDNTKRSGIFCVQFLCFKRHPKSLKALDWWANKCIEWCYNRVEENKFGDQKYLDDWPVRFKRVHVCRHPGVGIAPWNIQQYQLKKEANRTIIFYHGQRIVPVFYHFHGVRFYGDDKVELCQYPLQEGFRRFFYMSYVNQLLALEQELRDAHSGLNLHGKSYIKWGLTEKLKRTLGQKPKLYEYREFLCQN